MIYVMILANHMETALLKTILVLLAVFIVLIIIIFILSLLGLIPKSMRGNKKIQTGNSQADELSVNTDIPITASRLNTNRYSSNEDLLKDKELVAVITAAIMAYLGDDIPADGLIIRNIKRANINNWKKQ